MAVYSEMTLYGGSGQRLYLNPAERKLFAQAAITHSVSNEARTFCRLVYYTGCRISEALQLTSDRIDTANGCVIFRTLKKGKNKTTGQPIVKFRSVPVPESFIDELNLVHNLKALRGAVLLWPWSRATGWTRIKEILHAAGIAGEQAGTLIGHP